LGAILHGESACAGEWDGEARSERADLNRSEAEMG
jgi:hypothetical protein